MILSEKSVARLDDVHEDLQLVIYRAAEIIDDLDMEFVVTEGVRSIEKQRQLLAKKATTTLKSRHLTGHAVDLAVVVDGEIRWDWPLYYELADVVKEAAHIEGVPIEWGGDWKAGFRDGPHFQLPWKAYP